MSKNKILLCLLLFSAFSVAAGRNMGSESAYATHITPLVTAVMNTEGPVLELGCGDFSTPILHAICGKQGRFLMSAESNAQWLGFFVDLEKEWHKIVHVPSLKDWDSVGSEMHWGVVFVDHAPEKRRVVDIKRLRSHVDVFVIHDTQAPAHIYGYYPTLSTFKYQFTYTRYSTTTTLVSDTIDVASFFGE